MNRRQLRHLNPFGQIEWSDGRRAKIREDPWSLIILLLGQGIVIAGAVLEVWFVDSNPVAWTLIVAGPLVSALANMRLGVFVQRAEEREARAAERYIPGTFIR